MAYSRHAAIEIRQRLAELVGEDARPITVLTCHALAMRLVGASFAAMERSDNEAETDVFKAVLREATALLTTRTCPRRSRTPNANAFWTGSDGHWLTNTKTSIKTNTN